MVEHHPISGASYRAKLSDVMRRAAALEQNAHREFTSRALDDPERAAWQRIERHYATVRGNAQHLLLIHDWRVHRSQPLRRLGRYLHLL